MNAPTLKHPVKHLFVDLDGTLLGNRNLSMSVDFVRKALGTLRKYTTLQVAASTLLAINNEFKRFSPDFTNDIRVVSLFSERLGLSVEEGRKILREGVQLIFPGLEKHFFPIPGAREFLDWAKDHYTLTLATNPVWPTEIIELRLKWAGIDPAIFGLISDIRTMHACKPAREYYEELLKLQGLDAEDCLLIGNELKMDLPATRAGVRVFIVGDFKRVEPIRHPEGTALAWKGPYAALRQMLERAEELERAESSD
jgi:FMN phosphatase YigB (HAD superfamily)